MKRFLTLIVACVAAISMWAIQVQNTAGSLSSLVDDTSITQLTITGTLDARDFKFIADRLNNLELLNMSNAQIVDYSNSKAPLFLSATSYEAKAIPTTALMGKKLRSVTLPKDLKKIDIAAFAGCEQLENITLPASLEVIEPYAFSSCNKLRSITIPAGLKEMGEGAFSRCKSLKTASIAPSSPLSVAKDAFQDCSALSSVSLGANVDKIGPGAFAGCTALHSVSIASGNNLTAIAEAAFAASGVEEIDLTHCNNLRTIGMWAFANTPLKNVDLPASLESLGDGAFYYNLDLTQINLPEGITSLSNYLLAGDNAIDMEQPVKDGVTIIGDYAFYNWDQIRDFTFPESIEYVGTKAMAGQTSLEIVTAHPTTVPELGDSVWAGVDQPSIPLKTDPTVAADYKAAEQWKEFTIQTTPPTSIDENIAQSDLQVKAFFTGTVLNVTATTAIAKVSIFDVNGVLLATTAPASEQAQLNTANFSGKFYIVNVILANGNQRNFKLLRK